MCCLPSFGTEKQRREGIREKVRVNRGNVMFYMVVVVAVLGP